MSEDKARYIAENTDPKDVEAKTAKYLLDAAEQQWIATKSFNKAIKDSATQMDSVMDKIGHLTPHEQNKVAMVIMQVKRIQTSTSMTKEQKLKALNALRIKK